jgi:hypothetical protein
VALTPEQRAELEALGSETVRIKLTHFGAGPGAAIGFKSETVTRGDVEGWLAEKHTEAISAQQRVQQSTLTWARIAGWAAIISVIAAVISVFIGAATLWFMIWPEHERTSPSCRNWCARLSQQACAEKSLLIGAANSMMLSTAAMTTSSLSREGLMTLPRAALQPWTLQIIANSLIELIDNDPLSICI